MAKKKTKLPTPGLEETIKEMGNEELQKYIADPEAFNPELLMLAAQVEEKNDKKDMPEVLKVFLKALRKRHLKYKLNGHKVEFTYRRRKFFANLDFEDDFVEINFPHNIYVDKENKAKLFRLKRAVNTSNKLCNVSTYYEGEDNDEFDFVFVVSNTIIGYVSENPIFESELFLTLERCLCANEVVTIFSRKYSRKKTDKEQSKGENE